MTEDYATLLLPLIITGLILIGIAVGFVYLVVRIIRKWLAKDDEDEN